MLVSEVQVLNSLVCVLRGNKKSLDSTHRVLVKLSVKENSSGDLVDGALCANSTYCCCKMYKEIDVLSACTINAHKMSEECLPLRALTQVEKC